MQLVQAWKDTLADVLTSADYTRMVDDLEKGNDKYWVERYPEHIYEIFDILVELNTEIKRPRVYYFMSKGLCINTLVNGSYPLLKYLNQHNMVSSEALIYAGAKLDIVSEDGYNALEILLMSDKSRENVYKCEAIVYLIGTHVVIEDTFKIEPWIRKEYCDKYIEDSRYLADVIRLCCPMPGDPPPL